MPRLAGITLIALVLLSGRADAQWLDSFDTYALGPLAAQSDWEEWYSSIGVDAKVTDARAFSGKQSVVIVRDTDVVYPYRLLPSGEPTSGRYHFAIKTFVRSAAVGTGYVILLNQYTPPNDLNWSVQVRFRATSKLVTSDGVGTPSLPLISDEWVTFRVFIVLDLDRVDIYYGDQILQENASWKNGISGGGVSAISALDLYAPFSDSGITDMYFDDPSLQPADAAGVILNAAPNPLQIGQAFQLTTLSPQLRNAPAALFLAEISGLPFNLLLATGVLDATGKWAVSGTVPPEAAHLRFSLGALVLDSSGAPIVSNREVVLVP